MPQNDEANRAREAGLVPAGDVGLSTSAAAALLLGLHREGALEQSGDEAAQVAIEEQGADLNAQPVVEAFLIVLAPPGAALAAAPLAPTPAAPAVSSDAIRAVLDFCDASAAAAREEAAEGEPGDPYNEVLEAEAAVYEIVAGRLDAILPKPAPQEEIQF